LVEAKRFQFGSLVIEPRHQAYEAAIARVDYPRRTIWLDQALPPSLLMGEQVELGNDQHKTSFTIAEARVEGGRTALVLDKPLDLSYATVRGLDPESHIVSVNIGPTPTPPGTDAGLTCTDQAMKRSWKCSALGYDKDKLYHYKIEGSLRAEDFPTGSTFRLWECGVGDKARVACHVYLLRSDDKAEAYQLRANTPVTIHSAAESKSLVFVGEKLNSGEMFADPIRP
jgi:hypothetical protein